MPWHAHEAGRRNKNRAGLRPVHLANVQPVEIADIFLFRFCAGAE